MKSKLLILLFMILTIVGLAACGGGDSGDKEGVTPTIPPTSNEVPKVDKPVDPPTAPKDPVELLVYGTTTVWNPEEFRKHFLDPIEKKYPYIKMNYIAVNERKLNEMIAVGDKPDIIFVSSGALHQYVISHGFEYDISPLIKQYNYDLTQLDSTVVELINKTSNGGMYSLPLYLAPNTLYYNKNIFDKFGESYPNKAMTWDEVYDLSRKLTRFDNDIQYRGFLLSHNHLVMSNQVSQSLLDSSLEKVAFDTDVFKNYLQNLIRIYTQPGYDMSNVPLANGKQNDMFIKEQTVAMIESGAALYAEARIEPLGIENWDFTYFPTLNASTNEGYQPYLFQSMAITSSSEHKEAAFEAISYLSSKEFQVGKTKEGILLPVLSDKSLMKTFGESAPMYQGKFVEAIFPKSFAKVQDGIYSEYFSIATKHARLALEQTFLGQKDINTAFREASEAANQEIQTTKNMK